MRDPHAPAMLAPASPLRVYGSAFAAVGVVLALKLVAEDTVGREAPFLFLGAAILASGWIGGPRSSLMATVLCLVSTWYFFLTPSHSWSVGDHADSARLAGFVAEGAAVTVIVARTQAALRDASASDARATAIFESATDGMMLLDEEGRIYRSLPAAALTAYARADDRRKALVAGFTMHIPKPVEPAELVTVVASLARSTSNSQA